MHSLSRRIITAVAALLLLGSICVPNTSGAPATPAKEVGDLWEVTTQMSMVGMPMELPSQTQRICAAKDWKEPPGARNPQQNCQIQDFKSTPTKTTWKMVCEGPSMTGEGEIIRSGADAYSGSIKMTSAEGDMTIKLKGRRVDDCDPTESKRQMAQMQGQMEKLQKDAASTQAATCKSVAETMDLKMFPMLESTCDPSQMKGDFCKRLQTEEGIKILVARGDDPGNSLKDGLAYCNDAATKAGFCKKVATPEGTSILISPGDATPGNGLKEALAFCNDSSSKGAFCGQFQSISGYELLASGGSGPGSPSSQAEGYCNLKADDVRSKLCKDASQNLANLSFVGKYCPDQAKPIAEKECAGRKYTAMTGSPYQQFCATYAAQLLGQAPPADAPADESNSKKGKTKKFFKSIWPH